MFVTPHPSPFERSPRTALSWTARPSGGLSGRSSSASWLAQTREDAHPWQRHLFFDFARRHARIQGQLVPGLYEWVVAARGVADDNLAWEIFERPRVTLAGEQRDPHRSRRRRDARPRHPQCAVPTTILADKTTPARRSGAAAPTPDDPADWLGLRRPGLLYPPEDIVIEDYGRFLQSRRSPSWPQRPPFEPFTTSFSTAWIFARPCATGTRAGSGFASWDAARRRRRGGRDLRRG